MASWKLKVEDYGKIKSAEIEVAPLTLFVGDNNSGKSYLLSLLWGIENLGIEGLIGNEFLKSDETKKFSEWIFKQVSIAIEKNENIISLDEVHDILESIWNDAIDKNKDNFVKNIFNSEKVSIGKFVIQLPDCRKRKLCIRIEENHRMIRFCLDNRRSRGCAVSYDVFKDEEFAGKHSIAWFLLQSIYAGITDISTMSYHYSDERCVYLPAARTGFMLTKNVINKVGRKKTFNISQEREEITPFIRPINQFLDIIDDLSVEKKGNGDVSELIDYLEREMINGSLDISSLPNKEVQYIPNGHKKEIPLRLTSAVVTEIAPVLLILKHNEYIKKFYYEEPEMCLHPQLQHNMGKVITRIVNSGYNMVITTHSDIILQHINNMIKLPKNNDRESICKKLGYSEADFLSCEQVKVYQFEAMTRGKSVVKALTCGEDGFAVPTFNNALDKIMDEAYEIQG